MREFKQSIGVVIGINDYSAGVPRLRTAAPDAERLTEFPSAGLALGADRALRLCVLAGLTVFCVAAQKYLDLGPKYKHR